MSKFIVLVCTMALTACVGAGQMIPGTILSERGPILDFAIEKAHRSGSVTAFNSKTNESFTGTYVGILESISTHSSATAFAGNVSATGFGNATTGSNIGNAQAILKGDKGSTMTCKMQIEFAFSPHGIGTCLDNKGINYKLQF